MEGTAMKRAHILILSLAVTAALSAGIVPALVAGVTADQREETPVGTPEDEAAIRALFDQQGEAWNRHDGEGLAAGFAHDADFINITAKALRGRAEIARHHNEIFNGVYRNATGERGELRIRFIRPDVATIEASSKLTLPGQPDRHAHFLAVASRQHGKWELRAFHNMVPFVPPPPPQQ
jgi:uncharacterized protein (TIGR02246 family)